MAVPLNAKSKEERIREVQMADAADDLAAIAALTAATGGGESGGGGVSLPLAAAAAASESGSTASGTKRSAEEEGLGAGTPPPPHHEWLAGRRPHTRVGDGFQVSNLPAPQASHPQPPGKSDEGMEYG